MVEGSAPHTSSLPGKGCSTLPLHTLLSSPLLSTVLLPGLPSPLPPQKDSQFQVSYWRVLPSHQQGALEIRLPSSPESLTPPSSGSFFSQDSPLQSLLSCPLYFPSLWTLPGTFFFSPGSLLPLPGLSPPWALLFPPEPYPGIPPCLCWDIHLPTFLLCLPGALTSSLSSPALSSPLAEPFLSWSLAL